jgi:antitoxin HigA-1
MHPGELLREEILPALDRPKTEIAKLLGISHQTLYDVCKEKRPITPGMALRLGKLCGNGPDLWLNLQKRYDLHQAQQELGAKIRKNSDAGSRLKAVKRSSLTAKRQGALRSATRKGDQMTIHLERLKARLLANPKVKTEYDALAPEFEIAAELLRARGRRTKPTTSLPATNAKRLRNGA